MKKLIATTLALTALQALANDAALANAREALARRMAETGAQAKLLARKAYRERSAVDALGGCKFKPGVDESGKPVGAFANVEYVWKLD